MPSSDDESNKKESNNHTKSRLLTREPMPPPQRVLVVRKPGDATADRLFEQIHEAFENSGITTVVDSSVADRCPSEVEVCSAEDLSEVDLDLVITLGGDGTLLYVCSMFHETIPPVLSFNVGSLGFLTPFTADEVDEVIQSVTKGEMDVLERVRFTATVYHDGKPTSSFQVMNEVAVDRGYSAFLTQLECTCDGDSLTTVDGDGIIIATATGSTAYNLSAGGSVVHPAIPVMVFTPICPHSLSFRPITLPVDALLSVSVPKGSSSTAWANIDGRYRIELQVGDSIDVIRSPYPLYTVSRRGGSNDWFTSLRSCLNWNVRIRQKAMQTGFTGRLNPE
ncbi:Inorganic polyphosphate/ATP-NAD kinase [Carpediemonas membranifera]|uniref:Inorganic polyphosphate/ATP-NAD kinase n=1 Tax=Carpediemonas membranifera TaxID=201153 RepID=A0A8J6ATG0_9EUKA|nr:Inorganic polyphosphate/ATP-NAD kinase [Carpediemonas membranifera]|eukprot:KAG9391970.1 Inorganic polyphosphate/ATP-NAD kinase [Carpediemonas membranifera]